MKSDEYYENQRLSLKGQACTVRYVGLVDGKSGKWLGVEWDDSQRGKHDGTHEGRQYFQCRSKSPTAGSFLRPSQAWDHSRTFIQALTEKYMSADTHDAGAETVYFSGKQAEEVGFGKFSKRQAKLQGIHVLVLDRMRIKHAMPPREDGLQVIAELCAEITVLDLSGNLIESFEEIASLCVLCPKLKSLTLSYNHFDVDNGPDTSPLPAICTLALSGTNLAEDELAQLLSALPSVRELEATDNELSAWACPLLCAHLTSLDLSNNNFTALAHVQQLDQHCPRLQTLILKNNRISTVGPNVGFPSTVRELSIPNNAIDDWAFFNDLLPFTHIRNLRVTGNPLYDNLRSAEGKPLASSDGYMLTIARLPQLESLNYSKISEKERLNADTYYLGQIAIELGQADEDEEVRILARHPRYRALCEEYGEPVIQRRAKREELDPRSLAASLITVELRLPPNVAPEQQRVWKVEVPKSFDVYAVLALVGKRLGVSPLSLELVLETGEQDPMSRDSGYGGPEWWDTSDEEDESSDSRKENWTTREVVLIPSTRALGTYVEGREATINVRMK